MELREVFGRTLVALADEDPRVMVLDADLHTSTRTDLFKQTFPARFVQAGIAEQNMFGLAAGMAAAGMIPFPTTFAVFATKRANDQVSVSIAYPRLNVKIPGVYAGISTGKAGATHQSVDDLAIMRAMPNMRVLDPADATELAAAMRAMLVYEGPVYFRVIRPEMPDLFDDSYRFTWEPVQIRSGRDLTLCGTGMMSHRCLEAAGILATQGIEAAVVHVPCLKPLSSELLIRLARETGALVTAENHSIIGGLAGAVAEVLAEEAPTPIRRVGVRDCFVETGSDADIYRKYGLTTADIVQAAKEVLAKKSM